MRPIDAEALISELEKDEKLFDKEAEEARNNPSAYMEGYSTAMWSRANGIRDAIIEIHDAPTINQSADKPQGEWIEMYRNGFGNMICMCSKCSFHASRSRYCPNCGAKMKGLEKDCWPNNGIPEACRSCMNHPSNGGTGICHCTLGSYSVTCNSTDCSWR